jgi:hypothetical protein
VVGAGSLIADGDGDGGRGLTYKGSGGIRSANAVKIDGGGGEEGAPSGMQEGRSPCTLPTYLALLDKVQAFSFSCTSFIALVEKGMQFFTPPVCLCGR